MIKQQLHLKLQQRLTPLQLQQIKMLELSVLEIEQRIKEELEENPALEEGAELIGTDADPDSEPDTTELDSLAQDIALGDYMNEDEIPPYQLEASERKESCELPFLSSSTTTLYDSLRDQLALRELSDEQSRIAQYIVGNIEEDGYLRRDLHAIVDDLAFQESVHTSIDEATAVLEIIQDLDPAGIGARDLRECLLLQLERKRNTPETLLAYRLINECFDEFSKKHFEKIQSKLAVDEHQLKNAIKEVVALNPKPGNSWNESGSTQAVEVTPDFIVETLDSYINLSLNNRNTPELKISREYQQIMKDYVSSKENRSRESAAAVSFIKQKLDSARWFIDSVRQRQETLLSVMNAIIRFQREFFLSGDTRKLRPMTLKNIAQSSGYDISTVSRVSTSKYAETNFGIFPLKFFFSDSMQTTDGEDVSSREIKQLLEESIAAENKKEPLTDEKLCDILREKGYVIARRTVAKYREQLNIPVARLRKEI